MFINPAFWGTVLISNISCLELWILSEPMYFLVKNGDIPASDMLVKGFPLTSWGLPSSPLTSYGFQNSSRLREHVNHLNRLDTSDYLGISCCLVLLAACCCCACFLRGDWSGYLLSLPRWMLSWVRMHVFMEEALKKKRLISPGNAIWSWKKRYWEKHSWGTTFGKTPFLQRWSFMICAGFWPVTICLVTIHYGSKRLIHSPATLSTNTNPQRNLAIIPKELPTCPYKLFRTFASFRNCPSPDLYA